MNFFFETFATPLGAFSIAVNAAGAVVATAFGAEPALRQRLPVCHLMDDKQVVRPTKTQVLEYFAGGRRAFQERVWNALKKIPLGETRSYGQLAAELGNAKASRAVGRANATNPICLIVPCHRVIGADGSLTGFAFGEEIKRALLAHEQTISRRPLHRSASAALVS
jgi:methylated-DNA-[protein]-cysteine S-methyltransferase